MSAKIAYLLRTNTRVEPFDCHARELKVHTRTIGEMHRQLLQAAGFEVREIDDLAQIQAPCLCLSDDLYLTRAALSQFLKTVQQRISAKTNGAEGPASNFQSAVVCSPVTASLAAARVAFASPSISRAS